MKKATLIFGSILFSTLFYGQSLGLNISFFCLITLAVLITYNLKAFKQKSTIAYSLLYAISAISFFFFNSNLALIANIISFLTLVGHVSELNTSIYVNWLNGFYTFVAGFFHRNFAIDKGLDSVKPKKEIDYVQWIKIIGIPLAVITIFISLYRKGNPVFNDIINKIDFGFINFQWVLLSFFGYYLLYNISKPVKVNPVTSLDKSTDNYLTQKNELLIPTLKKENQLGVVLIALLNLLILFFLITDFTFLLSTKDLRASVYSNQVHTGINALIASIIMAIAIILYFFRGNLNFYKENTYLKLLAYIWIVLNLVLVINTTIKDCQYIYYFGFTYKRIGVLMYLLLTIIGLTTTAIKVKNIKNLWYLLRINTMTAFAILVISCTINWDAHITFYNLNYAKSIDFNYLIDLSNNNVFVLKVHSNNKNLDEEKTRKIENKYNKYLRQLKRNNWQEFNYDNFKL